MFPELQKYIYENLMVVKQYIEDPSEIIKMKTE